MNWRVVLTERARRDLRGLDTAVATRLISAIDRLAQTGYGDVMRLHRQEREWRLRIGDWRVRFTFDYDTNTMRILRIVHRSQAYRE